MFFGLKKGRREGRHDGRPARPGRGDEGGRLEALKDGGDEDGGHAGDGAVFAAEVFEGGAEVVEVFLQFYLHEHLESL